MPATLPARTMRYDAARRLLTMSIPRSSKRTDNYAYEVEETQPDEGFWDFPVRCFRVTNLESVEVYDCVIDTQEIEEPQHSCDCRGFESHQHCKHVDALLALVKSERI